MKDTTTILTADHVLLNDSNNRIEILGKRRNGGELKPFNISMDALVSINKAVNKQTLHRLKHATNVRKAFEDAMVM